MFGALILYLACGALAGVLAGLLGVGGGLIVVPALLAAFAWHGFASNIATHLAIGTSLATIVPTGLASTRAHWRRGAVDWPTVARMWPGLVLGSMLGGLLASHIGGAWLRAGFGLFTWFVAWGMLRGGKAPDDYRRASRIAHLGAGLGIGGLSALVGIGGGTLSVPWLHRRGLRIARAVATSSALGVPIALTGALTYAWAGRATAGLPSGATGFVYWPAFLAVIVASVACAPLGAALAHRMETRRLRQVFALFLILVGARLLFSSAS